MNKRTKKYYEEMYSQEPKNVEGQIATRTAFYRRELYKIVKSRFKIKVPDYWDMNDFLNILIMNGYIVITRSAIGTIAVKASLTGINYMSLPNKAVMAVPTIGNWEEELGIGAEIIFLERNSRKSFYNFQNLVQITAEKLASCDAGINVNVMNSRAAYMAEAETKAQADTIKAAFDRVSDGEPLVVYRKDLISSSKGLNVFFNNLKQNFIAQELQDTKNAIMYEFLTSIGINNANTDKKERLITNEVDANNECLSANIDIWKDNLDICLKKVKKIFPDLDFDIKLREYERNDKNDIKKSSTIMGNVSSGNQIS